MEFTPDDIELIDRYLRNDLSSSELLAFQERFNNDSAFADEVKNQAKAIHAVTQLGRQELASHLEVMSSEFEKFDKPDEYHPGRKRNADKKGGSAGNIATFVFIALLGFSIWLYFSNPHLFESGEQGQSQEKIVDTVYHYKVKRDTIMTKQKTRKKIIHRTDTVYYDANRTEIKRVKGIDSDSTSIVPQ